MSESDSSVSSAFSLEIDAGTLRDPARLTFDLLLDPHEVHFLLDAYEPLIGWIDPDLRLFRLGENESVSLPINSNITNYRTTEKGSKRGILVNRCANNGYRRLSDSQRKLKSSQNDGECFSQLNGNSSGDWTPESLPPFAVILFLCEEEISSGGRVECARQCLTSLPWKLHHCEKTSRRNLNLSPQSLDYFFIAEDLPLWSIRQVHYGKEHIRIIVQTKEDTWEDMVDFYSLILGSEPDFLRDDFCLFTVCSQVDFDIQFALKRKDTTSVAIRSACVQSVRLRFKVADLGRLVPLFPNVCQPVSDFCWLTTDHDGNEVVLDLTGQSCTASTSSDSSCTSASSSDVSFDSHESGNSHGSTCSFDCDSHAPRSTLDFFKRRKSQAEMNNSRGSCDSKKSQRRVTFCFDDVPPARASPPASPGQVPSLKSVVSSGSLHSLAPASSSSETMFSLRFDTCPTAPLSGNNAREEQIGFYV